MKRMAENTEYRIQNTEWEYMAGNTDLFYQNILSGPSDFTAKIALYLGLLIVFVNDR